MNIIITSASRKVWLIKAFQEALKTENIKGFVTAYDQDENAASLYVADNKLIQPKNTNWIEFLLSYIQDFRTDCVVPTRNGELYDISQCYWLYNNCKIVSSSVFPVFTCVNKDVFHKYCMENDFPVPDRITRKLFSKPIDGAGNKGTFTIDCANSVVQEFCDWPEYTIDVFIHPETKEAISAVPRRRIKVIDGEAWVSQTVKDDKLINEAIRLCQAIGLTWINTVQCFYNGTDIKWIEINPRCGGASALSIEAEANYPQWIVRIVAGREVKPRIGEFKDGLTMYKYTEEVFV